MKPRTRQAGLRHWLAHCFLFWCLVSLHAGASTMTLTTSTGDHGIEEGDPPALLAATGTSIRIGANNNATPGGRNAVLMFLLPVISTNERVAGAQLLFSVASRAGTPTFNVDLWGIGFKTDTGPMLEYLEADTGDPDPGNTKLVDNVLVPSSTAGPAVASHPALAEYVREFYTNNPAYGGGTWMFLRLNPDADAGTGSLGWSIYTAETVTNAATLTLVTTNISGYTNAGCTNFIVILTDDQRWDALGVVQREMGPAGRFPWFSNGTPNLDRLAAEGVRFRNGFVTLSLCSPSRAAIQTGRYNHLNQIIDNKTPFPASSVSFATRLRQAGYITGYMGKWHMDSQVERPGYDFAASYKGQGNFFNTTFYVDGIATPTSGWVDTVSTDYALSFIQTNLHRPFALMIGYKSTHGPRTPPGWASTLYTNGYALPVPNLDVLAPWRATPSKPATNDLQNYFRCLTAMDAEVGRILDALDSYGAVSNTMVIFAGDNGYYLGEHGLGDKRSAYDESLRIPVLVRYPKLVPQPAVLDQMILNIDFAPTILEAAGLSVPNSMQGVSWCPLFTGQSSPWRQSFLYQYFLESGFASPTVLAMRTTTAKLILYPGQPEWSELFQLDADPYETNNLYGVSAHAALQEELHSQLVQASAELGLAASLGTPSLTSTSTLISVTGGIGPRYSIEAASNLLSGWNAVSEVKMTTFSDTVTDTNTDARRFYRARMIGD